MKICLQQQRKEEFTGSHNAAENSQARSKPKILLVQYEMLPGRSARMLDNESNIELINYDLSRT